MLRNPIIIIALTTSLAISCKPTPSHTEPQNPESQTETKVNPPPQQDASPPTSLSPAQELAKKVFIAHGGPSLSDITQIHFTFDVQNDANSMFKAQHDWNLAQKTDKIQWTAPDSTRRDLLLNLETKTVEGTINDIPITEEQHDALAADAYQRWVNDTYWLLMPLKLQDPGVQLTLEDPQTIGPTTYQVLHMTFENVGLTPGDQYWVYIHPQTHHIARWDMLLQTQTDEPTTILWQDYEKIGPLTLPTKRAWPDSPRQIVFENTQITTSN